jgi:hypothetical protein
VTGSEHRDRPARHLPQYSKAHGTAAITGAINFPALHHPAFDIDSIG